MAEPDKFLTGMPEEPVMAAGLSSFEAEMVHRVKNEFAEAVRYRKKAREAAQEFYRQYGNAARISEMRAKHEFPIPLSQMLSDQFVAQMTDKLTFAGRPCRVVGVENTDRKDAEAKQQFMEWQDQVDGIDDKIVDALFNCAIPGLAIGQVDFDREVEEEWLANVEEVDDIENATEFELSTGELPQTQKAVWRKTPVVKYEGATTKIVDPQDFYFGPDKMEVADPFPMFIKTRQVKEYFDQMFLDEDGEWKKLFSHADMIEEQGGAVYDENSEQSAVTEGIDLEETTHKEHDYVEATVLVSKKKLYEHTKQGVLPNGQKEDISEHELTWAVCGLVDDKIPVRIDELPGGKPNIVVGCIESHGSPFKYISLMEKMFAIARAADIAAGHLITNIEQNIDNGWIINKDRLATGTAAIVNERGFILQIEGNDRVGDVAQKVESVPMTIPLQNLLAFYMQMARDATGMQAVTTGQGDPETDTLGEVSIVEGHAVLGLKRYLQKFENTFIRPLYMLRNRINMEFVGEEFRFQVLGEKANEWRSITREQIRANVDFICESSVRESDRTIKVQQMIKLLSVVESMKTDPNAEPVQAGVLLDLIARAGMSIDEETVEKLLPLRALEKETGMDVGKELAISWLLKQGIERQQLMALGLVGPLPPEAGNGKGGSGGGGGTDVSQPLTPTDAIQSATQENQVQVGT